MIYTYRNLISIFLQMNTWWYIHVQLYFNFPADEHLVIYTYRNFISIFLQINTWWYIHVVTFFNFPAAKRLMIYTYPNFIWNFLQMNTWWYIHTTTLYQFSRRWTRDEIYILQLYINFLADEQLMICTYRNFISTFLQMNTWWYIHTATLYQLSCTRTRDDMYIRQLYINFLVQFRFFVLIAVGVLIWSSF